MLIIDICEAHDLNPEAAKVARERGASYRRVAELTSKDICDDQVCGVDLCRRAGVD